jgi:hypothetical protein
MIAARLSDDKGGICVMLVLEPGNLEKLKSGQPIHKFLNEFIPELQTNVELLFAYTPDPVWVTEQLQGDKNVLRLAEIIEQSLSRPPIIFRGKSAEDMKKVFWRCKLIASRE